MCRMSANAERFRRSSSAGVPIKVKPGYVKFLPERTPVNLALSTGGNIGGSTIDHLGGVQVDSVEAVMTQLARIKAAVLPVTEEMGVNCCHANHDKFWVQDPDGVEWEVYHLNSDLEDDQAEQDARPTGLALVEATGCGG